MLKIKWLTFMFYGKLQIQTFNSTFQLQKNLGLNHLKCV